jgi:hypothetical protein
MAAGRNEGVDGLNVVNERDNATSEDEDKGNDAEDPDDVETNEDV